MVKIFYEDEISYQILYFYSMSEKLSVIKIGNNKGVN